VAGAGRGRRRWAGLRGNPRGRPTGAVRAEAARQDGHAALAVTGGIRNGEERAASAPPLRVTLTNKAGKVVAVKLAAPADPKIPPGGVRHFVVTLLDPPTTAADLEVAFDLDHKAPPAAAAKPVKHALDLRGSAEAAPPPAGPAAEAHPLPESSPYALPKDAH